MDNLRLYFFSYLFHNGNSDLLPSKIPLLLSFVALVQYFFMTIGVKLGNKIGTRFITIIGVILINVSLILMMISTNYAPIFISMIIFGLGCGLSNLSVIKNCWEYYPNRLGLINGIILAGFKFSSSILYYIGDYLIINPKRMGMKEYYAIYSRECQINFSII